MRRVQGMARVRTQHVKPRLCQSTEPRMYSPRESLRHSSVGLSSGKYWLLQSLPRLAYSSIIAYCGASSALSPVLVRRSGAPSASVSGSTGRMVILVVHGQRLKP